MIAVADRPFPRPQSNGLPQITHSLSIDGLFLYDGCQHQELKERLGFTSWEMAAKASAHMIHAYGIRVSRSIKPVRFSHLFPVYYMVTSTSRPLLFQMRCSITVIVIALLFRVPLSRDIPDFF